MVTSDSCIGSREMCTRLRRVIAQTSISAPNGLSSLRPRATAGGVAASRHGHARVPSNSWRLSVVEVPPRASSSSIVAAGEGEEDVVEGGLAHLDVVHQHSGGVQGPHHLGREPGRLSTPALSRRPSSTHVDRPRHQGRHRTRLPPGRRRQRQHRGGRHRWPPSAPAESLRRSPCRGPPPRSRSARASASSRYWVVSSTRDAVGEQLADRLPTPADGWSDPARSWARPGTAPAGGS